MSGEGITPFVQTQIEIFANQLLEEHPAARKSSSQGLNVAMNCPERG